MLVLVFGAPARDTVPACGAGVVPGAGGRCILGALAPPTVMSFTALPYVSRQSSRTGLGLTSSTLPALVLNHTLPKPQTGRGVLNAGTTTQLTHCMPVSMAYGSLVASHVRDAERVVLGPLGS